MFADVRFHWVPSVSEDVVSLSIGVLDDSGNFVHLTENLSPETSEFTVVGLKEKTNYTVSVVVNDGLNKASASKSFNLGDLSAPLAVTDLGFEVVKVYE